MRVYVRNLGGTPIILDIPEMENGVISVDGIKFPATQVPSSDPNTLDDYEEGTWTPVLTFATPGDLSVTYSVQVGSYTKIGRMVVANFNIQTSAFTHSTASGQLTISGLPFVSIAQFFWCGAFWAGITKANYTDFYLTPNNTGGATLLGAMSGSGQPVSVVSAANMPTGGTVRLEGCITYFTT